LGRLIGGTVIVETIFSLPGLGQALVQGVYASDIVVVQGLTLFMVLCVVLINFAVDALYPVVDPRVSVKSH
jgi:peptide/nickel transport system permease protein